MCVCMCESVEVEGKVSSSPRVPLVMIRNDLVLCAVRLGPILAK